MTEMEDAPKRRPQNSYRSYEFFVYLIQCYVKIGKVSNVVLEVFLRFVLK